MVDFHSEESIKNKTDWYPGTRWAPCTTGCPAHTDARRYVDQLKGQELDAYWTRASGSNKTWYQVRISHFKTKAEARTVGEDLKTRQLIGDYYVANYKRPDVP